MMTTIYIVTFTSYCHEDNGYLHTSEPQVFHNLADAQSAYEKQKECARQVAANEFDDLGNGETYDANAIEESDAFATKYKSCDVNRCTDIEDERYEARVELYRVTTLL